MVEQQPDQVRSYIKYSTFNTIVNIGLMTVSVADIALFHTNTAHLASDPEMVNKMFLLYAAMLGPLGLMKLKSMHAVDKIRLEQPEIIKGILTDEIATSDLDIGWMDRLSVEAIRKNYQYLLENNE